MLTVNIVSYAFLQSPCIGVLTGSCQHELYNGRDERSKVNSLEGTKTYRTLLDREVANQVLLLDEPVFLTRRRAVKIDEILT